MKREELESRIEEVKTEIKSYNTDSVVMKRKRAKTELKQLKKQLEELPKLEVGRWYKFDACLFNYQELSGVYGFMDNKWVTIPWSWTLSDTRPTPATDKEVQTALIAEAKKRGFKEGVHIKGLSCYSGVMSGRNVLVNTKDYYFGAGCLYVNRDSESNISIFEKGKWATIIKDKTIHLEEGDYTEAQLNEKITDLNW